MRNLLTATIIGLLVVILGSGVAHAQIAAGVGGALSGVAPAPPVKTLPLSAGQTHMFSPIHIHNTGAPIANWVGVRAFVHILDAAEVAGVTVSPVGPPLPAGGGTVPGASASMPVPISVTTGAFGMGSGIALPPSSFVPAFAVTVSAAGSSLAGNDSSADIGLSVKNLFHVPAFAGFTTRTVFQVPQSGSVFVSAGVSTISMLPVAPTIGALKMLPPVSPGTGTFLHVTATTSFVNLAAFITGAVGPSGIYALPATGVIGLGVTHIPEPSAFLCVGAVCLGFAGLTRWKRLQAA